MTLSSAAAVPDLVKYRLLDEIGHGGMATVYRALDVRLGREVAVKLIHPHLRDSPEAGARFINEAKAVAKLRHPGIVEIYDVSDDDDVERYLVTELIRGPSLRKVLRDHGALPPEIAACIGVQLCDALGHAHDASVVHRDVKPENVLIELDDTARVASVKLTDFGIAKLIDVQGVTSTGQVLGSPAHMAPEQIEGGPIDVRADIFSLGVLLYECMVGRLPFDGKNPAQVLHRVLDGTFVPADKERPAVGARWSAIVSRAIARRPSERYQDVREFGAEMRSNLEQMEVEDPLAEVYRFLSDATAYEQTVASKLVRVLVGRAERARAAGDIQAAAGDLNRAIAYAPDDAELLRRVTMLARGQRRKRLAYQAAMVLVPFAVLSVGTWAVVSAMRRTAGHGSTAPSAAMAPMASRAPNVPVATDTQTAPVIDDIVHDADAASPSSHVAAVPRLRPNALAPVVQIKANLGQALVSVDGGAAEAVGFGKTVRLSVGMHTMVFSVAKSNPCCESTSMSVEVRPAEDHEPPQQVFGRLGFRDARVSLVGGPEDARMTCAGVSGEVSTGGQATVKMTDLVGRMTCFLYGSGVAGQEMPVVLKAGELTGVRWPSP